MGHTYHKPHPRERSSAPGRTRTAWVGRLQYWLAASGWVGYLVFSLASAMWIGGIVLLMEVETPWARVAGGLGLIGGGLVGIFLAPTLAAWRNETPWLLRLYEEGAWGAIDYDPVTYRFFGSAVAGGGAGVLVWALGASPAVAGIVGVVACLGVWVWTWFAFTEID